MPSKRLISVLEFEEEDFGINLVIDKESQNVCLWGSFLEGFLLKFLINFSQYPKTSTNSERHI